MTLSPNFPTMDYMSENEKSSRGNAYTPLLVFLLIIAAFLVGTLWTKVQYLEKGGVASVKTQTGSQPQAPDNPPPSAPTKIEVEKLRANDHIKGNKNARILLIEYSDLECPFCKRFHPTAQQVVDTYKGKVAWVYRHFPIEQLHSKAPKEAEAVECAYEQQGNDGFWKLTDKIFEITPANDGLDPNTLPDLAAQVGLDKEKFVSCLESGKMAARVQKDEESGVKAGVTGTPGNILLDTKTGKTVALRGAEPFESVKAAIDNLLKES